MTIAQLDPKQVRLIDNGAKFNGPEALKRIKEGGSALTNSQITPILYDRNLFKQLPEDVKKELWISWLTTRSFIAKSDKPLGEKITYSYEGYSVTAIVSKAHQGSPYTLVSDLTPDNFNLEFKNGGKDAIVERKDTLKEEGYRGKITVQAKASNSKIEIIVEDNGMGIKEESIKRIFTPFFTTKTSSRKGTGLGLYVIKKIITDTHQGKLKFESFHGTGTRFILELPAA